MYLNSIAADVDRSLLENNIKQSMETSAWAVSVMTYHHFFFRREMLGLRSNQEATQHFTLHTHGLLQHLNHCLAARAQVDLRLKGVQLVVAGGSALRSVVSGTSAYHSETWNDGDVDVYILASKVTCDLPSLIVEAFHAGLACFQAADINIVEVPSDRAVNYHITVHGTPLVVQLITRIFLHPLDIVGWYDLSCCQVLFQMHPEGTDGPLMPRFLLTEAAWNAIRTG